MNTFESIVFAWFKKQNFHAKEKLAAEMAAVIEAERKKIEDEKSAYEYAKNIPYTACCGMCD